MSSIREFLSARDEYITRVKEELLGPGSEISIPDSEHELITNSPDVRYSIGILFPKNNKLNLYRKRRFGRHYGRFGATRLC